MNISGYIPADGETSMQNGQRTRVSFGNHIDRELEEVMAGWHAALWRHKRRGARTIRGTVV